MRTRVLFVFLMSVSAACGRADYEFAYLYDGLPFDMPQVHRPQIPDVRVDIKDYGAVPDGKTLNTEAFAAAIEALAREGGGHVDVPDGIWLTGPISLKSGIDLHLSAGAVIRFSDDPSLYPVKDLNFEGLDTRRCQSLIEAIGEKNVSITGKGIVDGNGDSWRILKKFAVTEKFWKKALEREGAVLSEAGTKLFPDQGYKFAMDQPHTFNVPTVPLDEQYIVRFLRPVMVGFQDCENVLLEGCTFQNSPCWNLHPVFCRNVIVKDVCVKAPVYSANGDGIDIDACENTIVVGSSFDVGDDAICVKSGKDEDGRRHARPTRNLIVDDCTVYHGHGGFVVGSEMSGGVDNVKVGRCRFLGTEVGLRFKSCRGRGGVVENIWIENIVMTDIMTGAIVFNLLYNGVSSLEKMLAGGDAAVDLETAPVDQTTPEFRNIHISDVQCCGAENAMTFIGLPEMPVSGISIEDCRISSDRGLTFVYCRDISLKNAVIDNRYGEKIHLVNAVLNED